MSFLLNVNIMWCWIGDWFWEDSWLSSQNEYLMLWYIIKIFLIRGLIVFVVYIRVCLIVCNYLMI